MVKRMRSRPSIEWKVESVNVKARDGPERVAQVYRLLLLWPKKKDIGAAEEPPMSSGEGGH